MFSYIGSWFGPSTPVVKTPLDEIYEILEKTPFFAVIMDKKEAELYQIAKNILFEDLTLEESYEEAEAYLVKKYGDQIKILTEADRRKLWDLLVKYYTVTDDSCTQIKQTKEEEAIRKISAEEKALLKTDGSI